MPSDGGNPAGVVEPPREKRGFAGVAAGAPGVLLDESVGLAPKAPPPPPPKRPPDAGAVDVVGVEEA